MVHVQRGGRPRRPFATILPVALVVLASCGSGTPGSLKTVLVEGGDYVMGTNAYPSTTEAPAHPVSVGSFHMGISEVTYGQFASFVQETAYKTTCELDGKAAYTIDGPRVEWDRKADGWRLPTEAEWEYAARGGRKDAGFLYSGSDQVDEVAWYDVNSGFTTHPVMAKKPNQLGIYDLTGNVYEWCWDRYGRYVDQGDRRARDPQGPETGILRVFRGGSWYSGPYVNEEMRNTSRMFGEPEPAYNDNGFRLVRKAWVRGHPAVAEPRHIHGH